MGIELKLSSSCVLTIQQGDITRFAVDAIVNAANETMLGGGGVDGAIHSEAGPQLVEACRAVPEVSPGIRCPTGQARITPAFRLPCQFVIHTVGPIFVDTETSRPLLESSYESSLRLANENGFESVAFPAISCGAFGYPHDQAAVVAFNQCKRLADQISNLYFVLFDGASFEIWSEEILNRAKETGIQ